MLCGTMKTDAQLIKELGTDTEVAALVAPLLGEDKTITAEGIRKWRELGIPWAHRARMFRLFKSKRLAPPEDFLEERRPAA